MKEVRVSNTLSEAHTLPSWIYTDPKVLEAEKKEKSSERLGNMQDI
jgi:carnitine monooxygenase subunit